MDKKYYLGSGIMLITGVILLWNGIRGTGLLQEGKASALDRVLYLLGAAIFLVLLVVLWTR